MFSKGLLVPLARALQGSRGCVVGQVSTSGGDTGKKRIAIFVEPSPFSHVSGMKIRFSNLIKGLRELGDDVMVFTPCVSPPKTFHGAKVHLSHPSGVSILGMHATHAS